MLVAALFGQACADLQLLLAWQRKGDSGAYVSSGFHDYRAPSKYRRTAGIHAGYDIAMWAGSPVRAAWSGRVVAVVPWYGAEYGVTVRDSQGYEATYGHISPGVCVGDRVEVGQVVGTVVVDHVDVKMRDPDGRHLDFKALTLASAGKDSGKGGPAPGVPADSMATELAQRRRKLEKLYAQAVHKERLGLLAAREVERLNQELKSLPPGRTSSKPSPPFPEPPEESARPVTDGLIAP